MPKLTVPVPVPAGSKWCPDCSVVLPVAQFGTDHHRKDGLRSYCLPCAARRVAASKQRRKDLADAGRRMTAPHRVTPAERDAVNRRFLDAMTETPEARAERIGTAKAAKPRAAPRVRLKNPTGFAAYPTAEAAKVWQTICGGGH